MVKLFVIPARDEPTAIILRRGPSDWYHLIQWHTRRDAFAQGAWFKGRIYGEKCDLSPDGRLLVHFVLKGSRSGTAFSHAWTAVSRPPWLHALVLWPQGTTYGGGGRFVDNRTLHLRGIVDPPHKDFPLRGLTAANGDAPLHASTDEVPGADWCGWDHRGSIVFTRGGQLFRRVGSKDKLLAHFTDLVPKPEPPPDWATRPL
ncbi:MAG: hypothetical protein WD894_19470 [Pirellulales bacterium]